MILLRLSGHSGAGKSRLRAALPRLGLSCPQVVLYTSRVAREGEIHGKDYYFLSRAAIEALPREPFFVGPVRNMLQAVDLTQLVLDLKANDLVIIELFHSLWPDLTKRLASELGKDLKTTSVFMTAIDPSYLRTLEQHQASQHIRAEVKKILERRKKDTSNDIARRSESAVTEILEAIRSEGAKQYARVFFSAPEGPDKDDDWTCEEQPVGRAKQMLEEFVAFLTDLSTVPVAVDVAPPHVRAGSFVKRKGYSKNSPGPFASSAASFGQVRDFSSEGVGVDLYCWCMKEEDREPYEIWYDGEYEVVSAEDYKELAAEHQRLH